MLEQGADLAPLETRHAFLKGGGEYDDPGLGRRRKIAYEDLRETLYNRDADS